ncbi:MAG: hypothetical protein PVG61_02140 [Dehalococcoidia bacterium]
MQEVNEEKRGNPLLRPFRWLFQKPSRWISSIILLLLLFPVAYFVVIIGYGLYYTISDRIATSQHYQDIRLQNKRTIEEISQYYEEWKSQNISKYKFELSVEIGGGVMWEGFGGISSGYISSKSFQFTVDNSNTVITADPVTGYSVSTLKYENCNSIDELFTHLDNIIQKIPENVLSLKEGTYSESEYYEDISDNYVLGIHVEFDENFGFPVVITIFKDCGSPKARYFERYNIVTYRVSQFTPIFD